MQDRKRRWILKGTDWAHMKRLIYDRGEGVCEYCEQREMADVHHIIFRSKHRDDRETNLIGLCRVCHDLLAHGNNRDYWSWEFSKYVGLDTHVLKWREAHREELEGLYKRAKK